VGEIAFVGEVADPVGKLTLAVQKLAGKLTLAVQKLAAEIMPNLKQ
jgi:hypothetical protein